MSLMKNIQLLSSKVSLPVIHLTEWMIRFRNIRKLKRLSNQVPHIYMSIQRAFLFKINHVDFHCVYCIIRFRRKFILLRLFRFFSPIYEQIKANTMCYDKWMWWLRHNWIITLTLGYVSGFTNRPSIPSRTTDTKHVITPNSIIVLHTGWDDWMTLEKRSKIQSENIAIHCRLAVGVIL